MTAGNANPRTTPELHLKRGKAKSIAHRRRGSAPHPRGAGAIRRRCPQGTHCGRREAAECRDTGHSGLHDSSQEGRRGRPAGSPSGSTRRPGLANRKTEDERARRSSSPGPVASARAPAHPRRRKPIVATARPSHACVKGSSKVCVQKLGQASGTRNVCRNAEDRDQPSTPPDGLGLFGRSRPYSRQVPLSPLIDRRLFWHT